MAATKISDLVIVPQQFKDYTMKQVFDKAAMFRSGALVDLPAYIPSSGKIANAPSYLKFEGADEVLSDGGPLTTNNIRSVNEVSVINFRGKSYGENDLVGQLAGIDPIKNLADEYADFWARNLNKTAVAVLKGAVGGADANNVGKFINDVTAVTGTYAQAGGLTIAKSSIAPQNIVDTIQLMGEYGDTLKYMVCHSSVLSFLKKVDAASFSTVLPSQLNVAMTTYRNLTVITDDNFTDGGTGTFTTYFMADGALLFSDGTDPALFIETFRDRDNGIDKVYSRTRFMMHPRGMSWNASATLAGQFPANTELATAANWTLAAQTAAATDANYLYSFPVRALKHKVL